MKKAAVLMVFLFSCANVFSYKIGLNYQPLRPYEEARGTTVTVASLKDSRKAEDKKVIGSRDGEVMFVTTTHTPSKAVSESIRRYLEARGYIAGRVEAEWDGRAETIRPEWGKYAVGGVLEEFSLAAETSAFRAEYRCTVKLEVSVCDVRKKEIIRKEKVEVGSKYKTFIFRRAKAEEIMNSAMTEAVEKLLKDVSGYLPRGGKTTR